MAMFKREELTDHTGTWRTHSLYMETNQSALEPILSLKDYDVEYKGRILPSMKQLYLGFSDPTEYEFALAIFGDYYCWQKQIASALVFKRIEKWRDELEIRSRSEALRALRDASTEGSKGISAAKYLAEKGWEKKAGRPSKASIEHERKILAGVENELTNDLDRLGIQH